MALGRARQVASSFVAKIVALGGGDSDLYTVTPIDTDAHPSHPIALPGDPWWPQPPIEPPSLPPPTMDWVYSGDGWYFIAGPYDKPSPICPTQDLRTVDLPKAKWTTAGTGWYFVFGPFDKPRAMCGVDAPDNPDPPTEPPAGDGCKWTYTSAGWVLCCGPYDKPKPIGPEAK